MRFYTEAKQGWARGSIVGTIFLRMVLFTCVGMIVFATFAYAYLSSQVEQRAIDSVKDYVAERGRSESALFLRAQENLDGFAENFVSLYADPDVLPEFDFDAYFESLSDATVRLREEFFTGHRDAYGVLRKGMSGFISANHPELTDELKRRLVLTYLMVSRYGPAWTDEFANLHVSMPENALVIYWPGVPWGRDAASDLDMTSGTVITATLQEANPSRTPVWTGLYFDNAASDWVVTYQHPVDLDGKHLITPSFDVRLGDLVERVTRGTTGSEYSLIVAKNGTLVAQPGHMGDLRKGSGQVKIRDYGDPTLISIYETLLQAEPAPTSVASVVVDDAIDAYLGFVELEGPDWWLVTVYPRELVQASARRASHLMLILIAILFAVLIGIVVLVLRTSIARPIQQLKTASEHVAKGDYEPVANGDVALPDKRKDEIGLLARSFRAMASQVGEASSNLERAVTERTIELQDANRQLEELSFRDGLTGAFNRRALDRDLMIAMENIREGGPLGALLLMDIDLFKDYNDRYGHDAGDKALCGVVDAIRGVMGASRLYRYGGEELAIIMRVDGEEHAKRLGAAVLKAVAEAGIIHEDSPHGVVTVSAGVTLITGERRGEADTVLRRADKALYIAKREGRNRLETLFD